MGIRGRYAADVLVLTEPTLHMWENLGKLATCAVDLILHGLNPK